MCVMFEVDGALADSNTFGDELYRRAIRDVLGPMAMHSAWSDYPHVESCARFKRGQIASAALTAADILREVQQCGATSNSRYSPDNALVPVAPCGLAGLPTCD